MKQLCFGLLYFCVVHSLCSQIQENQALHSLNERFTTPDSLVLPPFSPEEIRYFFQHSQVGDLLTGKSISVNVNLLKKGTWSVNKNGDKICRMLIRATNAEGLCLYFNDFNIANGSYVHVYSQDYKQMIGAFTIGNTGSKKVFSTQIIAGEHLIIEYFEAKNSLENSSIMLSEVGYIFKERYNKEASSGNCEVNVNCSEGDSALAQKRAISSFLIKKGSDLYWCSGTLVNNTQQNRIPYFLTADHCINGSSENDINQYQFYFNYESDSCKGKLAKGQLPGNALETLIGAKKLANSAINGGSDFALLLLNDAVPLGFHPYFNGWDNSESLESEGYCLHHPSGDIKKISTFANPLITVSLTNGKASAHWKTAWISTANGQGVTEAGSSGSPLFNSKGLVIATLSGGVSTCSNITESDAFGKLNYHWNRVGTDSSQRLMDWLDPTSTGLKTLHGLDSIIIETPDTLSYPFEVLVFGVPINNKQLNFQIRNSKSENYSIQLVDLAGKMVLSDVKNVAFKQTLTYALDQISTGAYFLRVFNDNSNKVKKILVVD